MMFLLLAALLLEVAGSGSAVCRGECCCCNALLELVSADNEAPLSVVLEAVSLKNGGTSATIDCHAAYQNTPKEP